MIRSAYVHGSAMKASGSESEDAASEKTAV